MLELWLTVIGIMALFFVGLYFFFLAIKSSVDTDDAKRIDKLPEDYPYRDNS
ncbi:hypothetical protein AB1K84_19985 [Mesobacillus foraminis]|uniref:hypothetical protein n=1 Tax=Mesobacillus foraminis TaxID=279826 RepID=UPI0013CEFA7D|nr:hypothetical protein [Mesobacillus foraminis]MBT2755723.1 hypothetical protein [Mesobacillus foraminis]